jgi:hypothetical protein
MTDISPPRIFDDNGRLIPIDPSTLPPDIRERYTAVRNAYELNAKAEHDLADAQEAAKVALVAANNTREYVLAHFPPQTQHDLWVENFGNGPHETKRAMGLIK